MSNRQTIALIDNHPKWQTLHKCAPIIRVEGIIRVGELCYPSATAGLGDLNKLGSSFPDTKSIVTALERSDIAHARSTRHDLSAYSSSRLPYFRNGIENCFQMQH